MLEPTSFATVRFSTEDLPEKDRVPMWREHYGRSVFKVDIIPSPDKPFRGTVSVRSLPGLQLMSGTLSSAQIIRSRESISDGNDDFVFTINQSGKAVVSTHDREVELGERDAVLINSNEVTTFNRFKAGGSLSLRIPRSILSSLVVNIDDVVMQSIPHDADALRLLTSYAGSLIADGEMASPNLRHLVINHVTDLVALTLGATRDAAIAANDRGVRAGRLRTAKAYIIENSSSRDLSIGIVAASLGVTPRYLQRLFEIDGSTFSAFLLGQRLTRAHRMLCEPQFDQCPVGAIAYEAGFGDLSYFNRCFRKLYGVTPRDIRDAPRQRRQAVHG
jgi:AraC-like DNA-binding protein